MNEHADDRGQERDGVDQERRSRIRPPQAAISHPPIAGPIIRAAARSDELVKGVRLVEIGARHQLRHDRIEGGAEERGAGTEGRGHDHDVPQLTGPRRARGPRGSQRSPSRSASAAIITRRRSNRSLTTPPRSRKMICGSGDRDAHDRESGRRCSTARRPATRATRGRCRRRSATPSSRSRGAGSHGVGAAAGCERDPDSRSMITPFATRPGGWIAGAHERRSLPGCRRGRAAPKGIPRGHPGPSARHRGAARRRR